MTKNFIFRDRKKELNKRVNIDKKNWFYYNQTINDKLKEVLCYLFCNFFGRLFMSYVCYNKIDDDSRFRRYKAEMEIMKNWHSQEEVDISRKNLTF